MIVNEICGNEGAAVQNTGGKKQCLEGAIQAYILAKETFEFPDTATAKTLAAWDVAKAAKNVSVFPDVEELEPNNTEAIIKVGRFKDYNIKDAIKGVNYTHYLGSSTHDAVKSYENSEFTRIFRITEKNELLCEVQDDGKVKGEPLTSFLVGLRDDAPADGTPTTKVQLKFDAYSLSVLKPDFDITDYEGIFDVALEQVSASATSIKFTAKTLDGTLIKNLTDPDVVLKDVSGAAHTHTFVAADADGVYELTGLAFLSDFTVELNGVVEQTEIMYEDNGALVLVVT